MDSVVINSPSLDSLTFNPPANHNLTSMLKDSVHRFLADVRTDSCDFSSFKSVSFRFLKSHNDPPLEVIWFYAAVCFHESLKSARDTSMRISAVRDLLQVLSSCSAASSGLKSVAVVAPAVSEILVCLREVEKLSGSAKETARKEIQGIIDRLISYVCICCGKGLNRPDSERECLLPSFVDVMRVWTVEYAEGGDGLGVLFPLVADEVRSMLQENGCEIDYLASVVVVEVFLLMLSLKVQAGGSSRADLQSELRIWAVSSITAFANGIFYETLLKLLLNPSLPLISPANAADESLVRDILYDAVIMVDYSFVNPDETPASIFIRRLIVSYQAIQVAREKGDQGKAISYTNAFSTSCVPNGLIRWASFQSGLKKLDKPNAATPHALLKWLIGLEEQGLRVFEDNGLKLQCKSLLRETKAEPAAFSSVKNDDLFFFDNSGNVPEEEAMQDENMDQMDTAFKSAAHSMKSNDSPGRSKRKERLTDADVAQLKSVKYKVHDSSAKHFLPASAADNMSSGSEVEDPLSDHGMDVTEQ